MFHPRNEVVYLNFRGTSVAQSKGTEGAISKLNVYYFLIVPPLLMQAQELLTARSDPCENSFKKQWEKKSRLTQRDLLSGLRLFHRTVYDPGSKNPKERFYPHESLRTR